MGTDYLLQQDKMAAQMRDYEKQVEDFLNDYIRKLMLVSEEDMPNFLLKEVTKTFGGKKFFVNSWIENLPQGRLLAIEAERRVIYGKKVYSRGIMISGGQRETLSQEAMWDLGLG